MATSRDQQASSSMSRCAYHVFVSFRGTDIRKTFIDHLHTALVQAEINAFRDDDDIERGEDIESELRKAIEESKVLIIIFSENYATSRWCLDELVKIVERNKTTSGQVVLPVFYHVDPSDVKNQAGSFGEAFATHEEEFKAESEKRREEWMERVNRWREALTEVANLAEKVLQNEADGCESKFIEDIVRETSKNLDLTAMMLTQHPVGLCDRVEEINTWVQDDSDDSSIGVICGMGGIGKTTIAKAVYNLNLKTFEHHSFLSNIREASKQPKGFVRLQKQLLRDILKRNKPKIDNVDEGISKIKNAICCLKVFIVLDDVDQLNQLNAVFGMQEWLYPGSKIIITSRNERLLGASVPFKLFKVRKFDERESLQLFSWHAFEQDHPIEGFEDLSRSVTQHCEGLPLALKVLGSSLHGRRIDVWGSALKKLKAVPDSNILGTLEVSYESLQYDFDKKLFLHIACFFIEKSKEYAIKILDNCDLYPAVGIQNLIERCLITIGSNNKLMMHQLLQDMAREIIHKESPEMPGKRTLLCHEKDSLYVLSTKTGTERIRGLVLNMDVMREENSSSTNQDIDHAKLRHEQDTPDKSIISDHVNSAKRRRLGFFSWNPIGNAITKLFSEPDEVNLTTDAFGMMHNLGILQLNFVQLKGSYEEFPKKLRWLCWHGFPLQAIPHDFPLESLIALDMRTSNLRQVWKGTKFLGLLTFLNLSHSSSLTNTPDFSGLPSLERLMLKCCVSLVNVHESIGDLEKLVFLNLRGCINLRKLPGEIGRLKSLEKLILIGCSRLDSLPMELDKLSSLTILHANRAPLNQSGLTIAKGYSWCTLFWSQLLKPSKNVSSSLLSLPRNLVKLRLTECNLSNDIIPRDFSAFPLLSELDLSFNPMSSLPEIKGLTELKFLILCVCSSLHTIPEPPSCVQKIVAIDCESLERMTMSPSLFRSIDYMTLEGCNKLTKVEGLFQLEPIHNYDAEIIKELGFFELKSIGNIEVELCNRMTLTKRRSPVQVLLEFGIFSTFYPGSVVPAWFDYKSFGPSVSVTVPLILNMEFQGLRMCVVYGRSDYYEDSELYDFYVTVTNKTQGFEWKYGPMFHSIEKEDTIWLSHWNVRNRFRGGDEVDVSMVVGIGFQVKECGVDLVYELKGRCKQSNSGKEVIDINTSPSHDHFKLDGDLSLYQRLNGVYVLSHYDLLPEPTEWDDLISDALVEYNSWRSTLNADDDEDTEEDGYDDEGFLNFDT